MMHPIKKRRFERSVVAIIGGWIYSLSNEPINKQKIRLSLTDSESSCLFCIGINYRWSEQWRFL